MLTFPRVFALLATLYVVFFLFASHSLRRELKVQRVEDDSAIFSSEEEKVEYEAPKKNDINFQLPDIEFKKQEVQAFLERKEQRPGTGMRPQVEKFSKTVEKYNPFALLGAYPDPNPYVNVAYNTPHYGLINDDEYCNKVDEYNLNHAENMFEKMNFFSDGKLGALMKSRVMGVLGTIYLDHIDRAMKPSLRSSRTIEIAKEITAFHVLADQFYKYHEIGKHYLCATQMFNHIPNHTDLIQKDHFPQNIKDYSLKYKDQPQCFDKNSLYPVTYRLFVEDECQEFFSIINSEQYKDSLKTEPIQYIVKVGHGAHMAEGVFLLDREQTQSLNSEYENGKKCGQVQNFLIVQKYITNPMLLHNNNKFHMRVYLLIASTNPFIAYYHDGYLRASAFSFDKFSEDRATHLTNLLTGDKIADALNTTDGQTTKQIEDFYIWNFTQLADYMLENGKTNDTNWLDNHLRPALQKAFVHVVRMTGGYFWKQSNVYELLGCDFMLDEDMNVWFLEANPGPLLDGIQMDMITQMLKDLFEIEYSYYRSRMKRVLDVIQRMQKEAEDGPVKNLDKWKGLYQEAVKNRLEPEYQIKETNTFTLIMDESLPGAEAYLGFIPEECVN